jgi:hypothetical protein
MDELQTITNQISSGSGSSSGNTISIPATQITWSNPSTGDTLSIQKVLDAIKTQITFLQNATFDAADISCKNSSNQTSDLQTQLNILYQLPTTPSLSQEEQEKLNKISGIEEDVNNIKSTLQSQSGSVAEKRFYISESRIESTTIMYDIAYGNNMLIAVGVSGTALTSESGNGYERRYRATWISYTLVRVIYGNNMFVAVGINGMIVTSRRGLTWTDKKINSSYKYTDIVYGNGMFVIVGSGGTILTSSNAINWEEETSPVSDNLLGIAYGKEMFVSVGYAGIIITSPDGSTWAQQTTNTTGSFYKIVYGKEMFVTAGDNGIFTSQDGFNWELQ